MPVYMHKYVYIYIYIIESCNSKPLQGLPYACHRVPGLSTCCSCNHGSCRMLDLHLTEQNWSILAAGTTGTNGFTAPRCFLTRPGCRIAPCPSWSWSAQHHRPASSAFLVLHRNPALALVNFPTENPHKNIYEVWFLNRKHAVYHEFACAVKQEKCESLQTLDTFIAREFPARRNTTVQ